MAANKRTQEQIEYNRAEIARRYLKGEMQYVIAEALGMTPPMVHYDLQRIKEAWVNSALVDFNAVQARELARIDLLEREYWIAWDRSILPRQITHTEKTTDDEEGSRSKASIRKEDRDGNSTFLAGIQWCIEQRCKIFGLYEPEKFAIVDWRKEASEKGINAGEAYEQLVNRYAAALSASKRADDFGSVERGEGESPAGEPG